MNCLSELSVLSCLYYLEKLKEFVHCMEDQNMREQLFSVCECVSTRTSRLLCCVTLMIYLSAFVKLLLWVIDWSLNALDRSSGQS